MIIRLTCPGQPVSAKNHQAATLARGRGGRVIPVVRPGKAITEWYGRVVPVLRHQYAAYGLPALNGPLWIATHEHLAHPLESEHNPDHDNALSGVFDALQKAGVVTNDRRFIAGAWTRQHSPTNPHILVEIRRLAA